MYKTKKEVDAHVRTSLAKVKSEAERNLRGFTIAKLYYKHADYSTAVQYLISYLSVKEDNDQAHRLLGQCYQQLKKPDKALKAYQESLIRKNQQPDVLAEVCKLLLEHDGLCDSNNPKYWCELAESQKISDDSVFSLRLKLMNKDNLQINQVEDLIQREITGRPNEPALRVRLVRNYIEQNKIHDAFKYIHDLEATNNDAFTNSMEWYNIVWLVLNKYENLPNTKKDWDFWLLLITCLERQVNLSFPLTSSSSNVSGITEIANLLFNLDQYLYKLSKISDKLNAQKELVSLFCEHYRGQLLLHAVSMLFKRELLQNKNKWRETLKSALPLLLLAYQTEAPDSKKPWMKHSNEEGKSLIQLWNREGSFRCAQAGRILLSCLVEEGATDKENANIQMNMLGQQTALWNSPDELLSQVRQTCADKQWRRHVFALLFCNSDQKLKEQSSLFIKCSNLAEPVFALPTYAEVERLEEAAQYMRPQSLQHMVYLCLGTDNLAFVRAKYFNGLNFSTKNLSFCGAESLNQLDIETFLYASTIQAKRKLDLEREAFDNYNSGNRNTEGKPRMLTFVNLQELLCSEEQANWWLEAFKIYKNFRSENFSEIRATLQFGIETVRGINGPKMDMIIVFKLGQIFVARAQDIVKPIEKAFLEERAENLYKYGLNMLKVHQRGILEPFTKYFKYARAYNSNVQSELLTAAEVAVTYLADRMFKKTEYEDVIDEFADLQLPFAAYMQAEAYRKLDESNKTPKKARRRYLDRATECLNHTLSLLKNTQADPNHPLNSVIHSELKRLQSSTNRYHNESNISQHNNSSAYEDAEDEVYESPPHVISANRSRREAAAKLIASPQNHELENLVKQMANTLTFVKDEIVDMIKPEVVSMRQEISSLKEKITTLEEAMKKTQISSNPPSRDDASNVLDDLYMFEEALQTPLYQQNSTTPQTQLGASGNLFPPNAAAAAVSSPFVAAQQQQQRMHTPLQLQQNAAAAAAAVAYNSPIFNPNYPMNYYNPSPYLMAAQQGAAVPNNLLAQRNPLAMPFMDAATMNYNMPSTASLLPQQAANANAPNFYSMFNPQQNMAAQLQGMSLPSLVPPTTTLPASNNTALNQAATLPTAFNKALNNQPVEKGPPANVVITNSDPLPNPNSTLLQQQPTLSVTIPSHHLKPSLVQTPESMLSQNASAAMPTQYNTTAPAASGAFTFNTTTSLGGSQFSSFGISSSSGTNLGGITTSTVSTILPVNPLFNTSSSSLIKGNLANNNSSSSIKTVVSSSNITFNPSTFSFKPPVMPNKAEDTSNDAQNKSYESVPGDKSSGSIDAEVEYDPRPDFKPIIPLPDEIEVKTGEEDEEIIFCQRAKLYRHVEKEWKERGIGEMKILKNKEGSYRILMRRDQTHKICANHKITKELVLTTAKNETKGYIWVANDFADEDLKVEKFFVRFKTPEIAKEFNDAFKKAQENDAAIDVKQQQQPTVKTFALAKSAAVANFTTSTPAPKSEANIGSTTSTVSKTLFGVSKEQTAFSTPSNVTQPAKVVETTKQGNSPFVNFSFAKPASVSNSTMSLTTTTNVTTTPFANIFSNLSQNKEAPSPIPAPAPLDCNYFANPPTAITESAANKSNASDNEDDYEPTAQFKPVIPLPDLIEVNTGEENEVVLFEHRAKILRFDKETGEWKERGIGNIKLLQDKNDINKVRLLMRREQVLKLCCNQRLSKDTKFKYAKNSMCAMSWVGQDFSENELVTEMLTIRFKTPEICNAFHEAVLKAQANMTETNEEDNQYENRHEETKKTDETQSKGFGDAFKPKAGSWSCKDCYVSNGVDILHCSACGAAKDDTVPKKELKSVLPTVPKSSFTFGFPTIAATTTPSAISFGQSKFTTSSSSVVAENNAKPAGFGDQFKPKAGSWACNSCYLNNTSDVLVCNACKTPKNDTSSKKETLPAIKPSLTIGFPASSFATTAPTMSFGQPPAVSNTTNSVAKPSPSAEEKSSKPAGFGDQFKPKAGSWSCKGCYLNNSGDVLYCSACEAPKDDTVPKKQSSLNTLGGGDALSLNPANMTKFSFGFPNTASAASSTSNESAKPNNTGFSFATKSTSQEQPINFSSNNLKDSIAASGDSLKLFTFTPPSSTSTTINRGVPLAKPSFSFSMQSNTEDATIGNGQSPVTPPFSLDKKNFSFTLKPKSPGKGIKSPLKLGGGDADGAYDDGDDADYEEEENNTYFTPVIPLPDKIDVKTGEEDEELLYVHRAKLFRYVDGEWKERGLGDVKILRHKETKKLRVVMRREQVLKICLNHWLNEDVEYKEKDDKSWLFVVNDFSESSVELEKFSLRFKTKDIAQDFMKAVKEALAGTALAIETPTTPATTTSEKPKVSADNKKKAKELQLPENFFDEPESPCSGCRGCDPDNFVFPKIQSNVEFVRDFEPLPMEMPKLEIPEPKGNISDRSILKQSALSTSLNNSSSANASENTTTMKSGGNIFNSFGGANSTAFGGGSASNTFSFAAAFSNSMNKADEAKIGSSAFLFGSSNSTSGGTSGSIFGGVGGNQTPSIFGNVTKSTENETPSIFGNAAAKPADDTTDKNLSIFSGNNSLSNPVSGGSIFGGKPFFGAAPTPVFGSTTNTSTLFGGTSKSIFGSSTEPSTAVGGGVSAESAAAGDSADKNKSIFNTPNLFGGFGGLSTFGVSNVTNKSETSQPAAATTADSAETVSKFDSVFNKQGTIDFASLAAKATTTSTLNSSDTKSPGGFIGLTNQDAFSSFSKNVNQSNNVLQSNNLNTSKANESGVDDSVANDDNYDPHYDPIIELPSEIVVSTGEEEEEKIFGERAKLFRYDDTNKEWKERGVGEIKVLFHPVHETYRLILRREQIHKLVLNHAVGADFSFTNMNNSQTSFVWAALNYAENNEGELEKLAIRFKKAETAEQFSQKLHECIEAAKKKTAN